MFRKVETFGFTNSTIRKFWICVFSIQNLAFLLALGYSERRNSKQAEVLRPKEARLSCGRQGDLTSWISSLECVHIHRSSLLKQFWDQGLETQCSLTFCVPFFLVCFFFYKAESNFFFLLFLCPHEFCLSLLLNDDCRRKIQRNVFLAWG